MYSDNEFDINEIDKQLEKDLKEHKKHVIKITILVILAIAFIFRGNIFYWLKFGGTFAYKKDKTPISLNEDPTQINFTNKETQEKTFVYKSFLNGNKITIKPMAYYKISGLVVATNRFFILKSEFFDSAALYDIGLAWGKLGNKKFYKKHFDSFSRKNPVTGARVLWTSYKDSRNMSVTPAYADSHFSHTHIVPATHNIMGALLMVHQWDKIEMEGYLVDMEYTNKKGRHYESHTSMSRDDTGMVGDRGNGACEVMYVTRIKLHNKLYK